MARYVSHDFYCIRCGKKSIPIPRKAGHLHGKNHLKKLYCPNCRREVNHIECRNDEEVRAFLEDFQNGVYKEIAEKPVVNGRSSRVW